MKENDSSVRDECSSYFITFILDTTLGIILTFLLLFLHDKKFTGENNKKCK